MLYFILGFIVAIAVFAGLAAKRSGHFTVLRSATMQAPASLPFEQVNVLKKWEAWSPFVKADPATKLRYEGEPAGVGAICHWDGPKTGSGSMRITESRPNQYIRFELQFLRPFKATHEAEFIFLEDGEQTHVSWSMSGTSPVPGRIMMNMLFDNDRMCGTAFAQGLADIKKIVEAGEGVG